MNNNFDPNQPQPAQPDPNLGYPQQQQPAYQPAPMQPSYPTPIYGGQVPIAPKKKNRFVKVIAFAIISVLLIGASTFFNVTPEKLDVNNMGSFVKKYVTVDINYLDFDHYAFSGSTTYESATSRETAVAQFDYANPENAFLFGVWHDREDYNTFDVWQRDWINEWNYIWDNEIGYDDEFFSVGYDNFVYAWESGYYKEWGQYSQNLEQLPAYTVTGYLMEMDSESVRLFDEMMYYYSIPSENGKHYIIKQDYVTENIKYDAANTIYKCLIIAGCIAIALTVLFLILALIKKDAPTPAPAFNAAYPIPQANSYGAPATQQPVSNEQAFPVAPPDPFAAPAPFTPPNTFATPVAPLNGSQTGFSPVTEPTRFDSPASSTASTIAAEPAAPATDPSDTQQPPSAPTV